MSSLREALDEADTVLSALGYDATTPIRSQIKQALAEPLRNCDVGTAEEQVKRWEDFCASKHIGWKIGTPLIKYTPCNCPCYKNNQCNWFVWGQMPYKEVSE